MQRSVLAKRIWLLFFLVACCAYFYGLGNFPFIGPDEPRYAEVAREMYARSDPVTPTLGGRTWFEKPALPYWMMMAAYSLFGAGEWAARVGFVLTGLLSVLVLYWIGARTERAAKDKEEVRWLAVASGIAAASSAGLILFSHGVNFDIPLTLTTTTALACFLAFELDEEEGKGRLLLAGFYVGTGAALLAKGLVGFIITFGVVLAYYVLRRAWPRKPVLSSLVWGVPLTLLVASVWYAPVVARHGWAFIDEFIVRQHFARYTSNKYHHPQPFYFYIPVILLFALPWTFYLIESAASARHWTWHAPDALSKYRVFALCWLIVPVLFFSASGSKLPGYVLPALPGAVLLAGERVARSLRGEGGSITMRATGAAMALLGVASLFFIESKYFIESKGYSMDTHVIIGAVPLVACGLVALLFAKRRWLSSGAIAAAMFLMAFVALAYDMKKVSRRLSVAHAFELASARGYGAAPVYQLHTVERTAEYYAAGRLQYGADGEPLRFEGVTQIEQAAQNAGGTLLVIVPSPYTSQLTSYAPLETELIEDNGDVSLVAVRVRQKSRG